MDLKKRPLAGEVGLGKLEEKKGGSANSFSKY